MKLTNFIKILLVNIIFSFYFSTAQSIPEQFSVNIPQDLSETSKVDIKNGKQWPKASLFAAAGIVATLSIPISGPLAVAGACSAFGGFLYCIFKKEKQAQKIHTSANNTISNQLPQYTNPPPKKAAFPSIRTKEYVLDQKVQNIFIRYAIAEPEYTWCKGTLQQQAIHTECLEVIKTVAEYTDLKSTPFEKTIVNFVDTGCAFNKAGICNIALKCLDVSWSLLKCIPPITSAVAKGTLQGVCSIPESIAIIVLHPIETAQNFVAAAYHIRSFLKEIDNLAEVRILAEWGYSIDKERLDRADAFVGHCNAVENNLAQYIIDNPYDAIQAGAKYATQIVLTRKLAGLGQALFNDVATQAPRYFDQISTLIDNTLSFQDGMLCPAMGAIAIEAGTIAIAEEYTIAQIIEQIPFATVYAAMSLDKFDRNRENFKNRVPKEEVLSKDNVIKINNMNEFFELNFGKELKSKAIKIRGDRSYYKIVEKINHQDLKKGDYFYLDKLHCDHIEIFDKRGRVRSVLNLDGSLNNTKTAMARSQKRTIII